MAYEETLVSITLDADASIGIYTGVPGQPGSPAPHGAKQYHFVKVTGAHTAGLTGLDEKAVGVLQNKPQSVGAASTVAISGVSLVVADGPIEAGDNIYSDAAGRASATGISQNINGVAIESAGGAGELIPVLLTL